MTAHRRPLLYSIGFAIFGAGVILLTYLAGGENGTAGGYVAHPVVRLAGLVACGALVGGALGWLVGAGPARATILLGFASLAAIIGFLVGVLVYGTVLGGSFVDGNPSVLLASLLVGAGNGWFLGACAGFVLARDAVPPTKTESWVLRGLGLAALLAGGLTAWFEGALVPLRGPNRAFLGAAQAVTITDALLLGLTLVIAAGFGHDRSVRAPSGSGAPGARFVHGMGKVGVVAGCLVAIALFAMALQSKASTETFHQARSNSRTAGILADAASRYRDETGVFPADLETLLAFDGRVPHGSFVNFAGVVHGRFCVRVGTDVGLGYGVQPFYSALAISGKDRRSHVSLQV